MYLLIWFFEGKQQANVAHKMLTITLFISCIDRCNDRERISCIVVIQTKTDVCQKQIIMQYLVVFMDKLLSRISNLLGNFYSFT